MTERTPRLLKKEPLMYLLLLLSVPAAAAAAASARRSASPCSATSARPCPASTTARPPSSTGTSRWRTCSGRTRDTTSYATSAQPQQRLVDFAWPSSVRILPTFRFHYGISASYLLLITIATFPFTFYCCQDTGKFLFQAHEKTFFFKKKPFSGPEPDRAGRDAGGGGDQAVHHPVLPGAGDDRPLLRTPTNRKD